MFRSFISDGKIVYFRGISLIWSYFHKIEKPILVWNAFLELHETFNYYQFEILAENNFPKSCRFSVHLHLKR
jgi:hypothetical protein